MLCVPTFLLNHMALSSSVEMQCRKLHLASFIGLVRLLEDNTHDVYCALRCYHWKYSGLATPENAVKRDWEEVQKADHIIACPIVGDSSSQGVHVEVGWATALKKPLSILIHRPQPKYSVMITGLKKHRDFDVKYFYYNTDPSREVFSDLIQHLASYKN